MVAGDVGVSRLIVWRYDSAAATRSSFFKDGIQIATATDDCNGDFAFQSPWRFGRRLDGLFPWGGRLGEVRFYNCAKTDAEIWQMYDPPTRWELYRPVVPLWTGKSPIAARIPKPPAAYNNLAIY
ncbi:MAG TPA: hypothetical protein VM223_12950, partial [Planctomycetota bacterium]|nr:hypothetical protein [Planctomycetota bacterium]